MDKDVVTDENLGVPVTNLFSELVYHTVIPLIFFVCVAIGFVALYRIRRHSLEVAQLFFLRAAGCYLFTLALPTLAISVYAMTSESADQFVYGLVQLTSAAAMVFGSYSLWQGYDHIQRLSDAR